jgi:cell division protease FtsH
VNNQWFSKVAVWLVIALVLFTVFKQFERTGAQTGMIGYSDFLEEVRGKRVRSVTLQEGVGGSTEIRAKTTDDKELRTTATYLDRGLVGDLINNGVKFDVKPREEPSFLLSILASWGPILLLIGVWIYFMRQMQGGGKGGAFSFGKSKARMLDEANNTTTFADVAGCDEAKEEVKELVDFLKDPQKFQKLGGRIPRGVLLVGPPGTGKTLLAKAIAGEAKVPFFSISGSDFVEMFVGVGAARVRDMFEQAKKNAPCIVFIDEIDAVGRHRGAGLGGGNDEREQTLNQLLVEMDGFEANEGVILIAATNRPDVLDPALLRPGRFDRQVVVPNPDVLGREKILKVHMRKVPLASDVDPKIIARGTPGFSGADLANLVNEAALMAARRGKRSVAMSEFEQAKDKVMMGAERRSMVMTEDEKKLTAYHEAGHALCMLYAEGHEPLHKVTIIPRGRALGVTMFLPERDKYSQSKIEIKAMLASLFGGRIAEELIFGPDKVTTGAADDIRRATGLARRMVTEFGFSEKLGPLRYAENEEEVFLGHSVTQRKNVSEATAKVIDEEIRRIIDEGEQTAREILSSRMDELHALAKGLLEYETLAADEIRRIIKGERIVRETSTGPVTDEPRPGRRSSVPPSGRPTGLEPEPQPGG